MSNFVDAGDVQRVAVEQHLQVWRLDPPHCLAIRPRDLRPDQPVAEDEVREDLLCPFVDTVFDDVHLPVTNEQP